MNRRIAALLMALVLIVTTPGLLICVNATESETEPKEVYEIGDDVWVQGQGKEPPYKTVSGGMWSPVVNNGIHDSKAGVCPIPDHPTHLLSCYGPVCSKDHEHTSDCNYGNAPLICGLEIHEDGKLKCVLNRKKKYDYYHWRVISDGSETLPTAEPTEGPTAPPVADNPQILYIDCMTLDPAPKRLPDVEFILTAGMPPTDPNETIPDTIALEKTKGIEGKGIVAALDFSEYVREKNITEDVVWVLGQMQFTGEMADRYAEITEMYYVIVGPDDKGNIILKDVSLAPPQVVKPESPEGEGAGTENEEDAGELVYTHAENYSIPTRTLTVVVQPWKGTVQVDAYTLGFGITGVPDEFEATVTLTMADGKEQPLKLPGYYMTKENVAGMIPSDYEGLYEAGAYHAQYNQERVDMGTYKVSVTDPVEIEGYTAKNPRVMVYCPMSGTPEETMEVTLSRGLSARFVVIYEYTPDEPTVDPNAPTVDPNEPTGDPNEPTVDPNEPTGDPNEPTVDPNEPTGDPSEPTGDPSEPTGDPSEPTGDPSEPSENPTDASTEPSETKPVTDSDVVDGRSNTVVVKIVDDLGQPLNNCEIGLYNDKKLVKKWKATYDNTFVLDDLEDLLGAGESATYILRQTKAAAGYRLSGDTFKVTVTGTGSGAEVEVKKNSSGLSSLLGGTGVEVGTDGKRIVTFVNERKTAQIELLLDVVTDFAEGVWKDEALIEGFREREYEFILTWENAKGEQEEKTVVLTAGTSEILDAELPFGTDYSVRAVETDGHFRTKLSDNFEGTIGTAELVGTVQIQAVHTYSIEAGEPLAVSLVKVDADTKTPLEGVIFSLRDAKGNEVKSFVSGEQGQMELVDVFTAPGTYRLVETQTLEGYELLRSDVAVDVTVQYSEEEKNGMPVLVQTMSAQLSGGMIVEESDGSFWVENARIDSPEDDGKESRGLGIGTIIGLCAAGVAGAAGVAAVLIRRKRRKM